jgi:hypothetical protein
MHKYENGNMQAAANPTIKMNHYIQETNHTAFT